MGATPSRERIGLKGRIVERSIARLTSAVRSLVKPGQRSTDGGEVGFYRVKVCHYRLRGDVGHGAQA